MSYLPAPHYLGSVPGSQSSQRGYGAAGNRSAAQSNVYHSQLRGAEENQQQQDQHSAYGWSDHNASAPTNHSQNTYATDTWQDRTNSGSPYNCRRETYTTTPQVSTNSQTYQSRDPYSNQDTQGLNHLAYASGLDTSIPSTQGTRPSPYQQEIYTSSASGSSSQTRTSLTDSNNNGRYSDASVSQSHMSGQYSVLPDNSANTAYSQGLALNATLALSGSGRNKSSQPSPQLQTSNVVHKTNSPSMRNVQSVHNSNQRANAIHSVLPTATHNSNTSTQPRSYKPVNPSKNQPAVSNISTKASPVQRRATPKQPQQKQQRQQQTQAETGTRQPPKSKQSSTTQQAASNNPQSIANLVSDNQEPEPSVYESVESVASQDSMPHYIDPTQVFNPYHREHERKKREMAELEVRKAAEEKRLAEARTDNKGIEKIAAPNSSNGPEQPSQPLADSSSDVPDSEGMATELQKMMMKMKEYRKHNPALFQKLWNDMRGGGSIPAPNPPPPQPTQSPSPHVTQAPLPNDDKRPAVSAKPRAKKGEFDSPYPGIPGNGFRVVVENNPQGLPDLGRFPAERRIRTSYSKNKNDTNSQAQQPHQILTNTNATPILSVQSQAVSTQPVPIPKSAAAPRPAESGFAWPEPRRRAVAIAAVHLLNSNPDNSSTSITTPEISSILERNPSYLDLCTALETRGLKFQRTVFARELLRSVPELHTPVTKAPTSAAEAMATVSSAAQVQLPSSATIFTAEVAQPPTHPYGSSQFKNRVFDPSPTQQNPGAVKTEQHKSSYKQPAKSSKARTSSSNRPEPPVGSKAAAARKRDFADLIDLTELNNDDNYVMPEKRPRVESPPATTNYIQQLEDSMRTGFSANSTQPLRFNPQPMAQPRQAMAISQSPYFQNPLAPPPPRYDAFQQAAPQDSAKQRMLLTRKIDKSEAMRKPYYDPKTVARDILIASGRHPSERPLNVHLAGLLGKYSDLDSDIGSFDWDSIDPGGPPPPRVEHVDISLGPPRFKLGGRMRKRVRYVDETSGEQDHKAETTKAEVQTLETRPTSVMRNPSQTHSPAPSIQNTTQSESARNRQNRNHEPLFTAINNSISTTRKISIDIPPVSTSQRLARSESQQISDSSSKMDHTLKRRGRPPGSKNKYPSVAALKQQAIATVTETTVEEAPEPILHTYKCKWVKCHAELHNLDTLRRHIIKKHTPSESEVQTEDFICWWKRCRFLELDADGNMAPTRVFKDRDDWMLHIDSDHLQPVGLKYGDGPRTTNTGKQISEVFDLSGFRYKPNVSPTTRICSYADLQSVEAAQQQYLTDTNGRATTPLVTSDGNSDHPTDTMILTKAYPQGAKNERERADITSQSAYLRAHGNKAKDPRRIAEEVVRAHEVRKQAIGAGLDRGGCTLINEARRETFIHAPAISRIVDIDY